MIQWDRFIEDFMSGGDIWCSYGGLGHRRGRSLIRTKILFSEAHKAFAAEENRA